MTDGYPSDDYQAGLKALQSNSWYKFGLKAALGIGQEANDDMLAEFTGTKDTVVHAYSGGQLAQMIKVVAVTASQIGSKSMTLSNETGEEVENDDVYAEKQKLLGQQVQAGHRILILQPDMVMLVEVQVIVSVILWKRKQVVVRRVYMVELLTVIEINMSDVGNHHSACLRTLDGLRTVVGPTVGSVEDGENALKLRPRPKAGSQPQTAHQQVDSDVKVFVHRFLLQIYTIFSLYRVKR
jgi:hypothetical protein